MAKASTVTLSVTITGDGESLSYSLPAGNITNAAAPMGGPIPTALTSGDNTITVPSGAVEVLIVPPAASVVVKKLKGIGGDTGVTISPSQPMMLSLPAGATTFILNAGSTETVTLVWT